MYIIFHHFISTLCHFFNWPQVFTHQSIRNKKMKRKKKRQIVLLLFQDCFASFCKMLTHVIPTDNNVTTSISTHSNIWNKQIFMLSAESSVSIALVNWYLTKYIYESYISGRNDRWPQKFTLYKSFFFFFYSRDLLILQFNDTTRFKWEKWKENTLIVDYNVIDRIAKKKEWSSCLIFILYAHQRVFDCFKKKPW